MSPVQLREMPRSRVASGGAVQSPFADEERRLTVLGVEISDVSMARALERVEEMLRLKYDRARVVYFVNTHTLNLAATDLAYRAILNSADRVFGDGTGVRWAARLQGLRLHDNVNGTDLVPALLNATQGKGYRCFLLGTDADSIRRAADYAAGAFPGWTVAGCHHGYLCTPELNASALAMIREARPDLLLVGMGNPLQESWIHRHRDELGSIVCVGVGGLFQYWAGTINRAPQWLRGTGFEWLGILVQQPSKAKRYLLGNPLFLSRILREAWYLRRRSDSHCEPPHPFPKKPR